MIKIALSLACSGLLVLIIMLSSCKPDTEGANIPKEEDKPVVYPVPKHFPRLEVPEDNQPTETRLLLGQMLFFDPILSEDSTISCASCHLSQNAFSDIQAFSTGVRQRKTTRNSMPLVNIGYGIHFFWDAGVPTLEQQAIAPIENPLEMNLPMAEALKRLKRHPKYLELFKKAYNREPDVYSLTRALACFERSLIGGDSPYDKYLSGTDTNFMSPSAKRGMHLFFSEKAE